MKYLTLNDEILFSGLHVQTYEHFKYNSESKGSKVGYAPTSPATLSAFMGSYATWAQLTDYSLYSLKAQQSIHYL